MTEADYIKEIREQANSYEHSIQAIISFDSAVRYDDQKKEYVSGSYLSPGRKLNKGSVDSDDQVTPDIVIQLSEDYGIIGEVKITASTNNDFKNASEQMHNYDNELYGWRTEAFKVDSHDLSLLVHDLNRNVARRYFEKEQFDKKFNLIACALITRANASYKIEKYFGVFSNERIEKKLEDPVAIPLEKFVKTISEIKFYDVEPPIEYTMDILWMNLFNEISKEERKGKIIEVNCKKATAMLNERFTFPRIDERQPKVPREAWVRRALDSFVAIGYGEKDHKDNDTYHIRYFYMKKESMLEVFAKKYFQAKKKKIVQVEEEQLEIEGLNTSNG
ncbi:MAG: hypothetical protein P9M00_01170 [Candidatus Tritonobacter lacicola]|nr:hypothetical protein [Candidatus Tritonobacter lacicola]